MALEKAEKQFIEAEKLAMSAGNNANVSLLREAQQCLKVWQEKRENNEVAQVPSVELKDADSTDSADLKDGGTTAG